MVFVVQTYLLDVMNEAAKQVGNAAPFPSRRTLPERNSEKFGVEFLMPADDKNSVQGNVKPFVHPFGMPGA